MSKLPLDIALEKWLSAPAQARRSPAYHDVVTRIWEILEADTNGWLARKYPNLPEADRKELTLKSYEHLSNTVVSFTAQGEAKARGFLRNNLRMRTLDRWKKLKSQKSKLTPIDRAQDEDSEHVDPTDEKAKELHAYEEADREDAARREEQRAVIRNAYDTALNAYMKSIENARFDRQERDKIGADMHTKLIYGKMSIGAWYDSQIPDDLDKIAYKGARNSLQAKVGRFRKAFNDFLQEHGDELPEDAAKYTLRLLQELQK